MNGADNLFLDTNLLVYAHDRMEFFKGPQAQGLLARIFTLGRPKISIQVMSEFFSATTRKIALPLTTDESILEISRLVSYFCTSTQRAEKFWLRQRQVRAKSGGRVGLSS